MARPVKIRLLSASLGLALAITAVVAVAASANSTPQLPAITPQALLASVVRAAESTGPPVSGRVTAHLDLGLPELPDALVGAAGPTAGGVSALASELAGDHRFRVWSSADGLKVAELLTAAERSVTVSTTDAWAWDSRTFTAYHLGSLPKVGAPDLTSPAVPADLADPERLAAQAIAAIEPTTAVSVGTNERIAGRASYVLVLETRTSATLVGRIEIGIDAKTRVPLSVTVFPSGSARSAIDVRFTSVGFGPIDPSTYLFTPPKGATVVTPKHALGQQGMTSSAIPDTPPAVPPRVFGAGWATIVAVPAPSLAELRSNKTGDAIAQLLPFSGRLFSVRLVGRGDHAWLVLGLVPQSALAAVESELS